MLYIHIGVLIYIKQHWVLCEDFKIFLCALKKKKKNLKQN